MFSAARTVMADARSFPKVYTKKLDSILDIAGWGRAFCFQPIQRPTGSDVRLYSPDRLSCLMR
ncbi:hypothetical protein SBA2_780004 [Acidobacteriia bacterium SbA2]|nr:hypothetical protein SBA2_780004 [Acidobacteriia bacterium SbA2]